MWDHSTGGVYGHSHLLGGFASVQAEYARVPFTDTDHLKIPAGVPDEKVLFLNRRLPDRVLRGGELRYPAGRHDHYLGMRPDRPVRGSLRNRGITPRTGQTPVQASMDELREQIMNGEIDPSFIITHQPPLNEAPRGYPLMNDKSDGCVRVVLKP